MNILFMGTPDIAAAALEAILDAGHTVCGVYTRADKPVGRKQVLTAPPVKRTAMAHGIPVFQPGTLRDAAQAENIRALAPELIVVVAYGRILPPEVLAIPICTFHCFPDTGALRPCSGLLSTAKRRPAFPLCI